MTVTDIADASLAEAYTTLQERFSSKGAYAGRMVARAATADPPIPTDAAELEEMLADPGRMENVFKDKDAFKNFIGNYAKTVMDKDTSIAAQVREETQLVLAEFLKEQRKDGVAPLNLNVNSKELVGKSLSTNRIYNSKAPGAQIDKDFEDSAEFFRAIWHGVDTFDNAAELKTKASNSRRVLNSYGSTVPADGGFLIPEILRSTLLQVALETAVVRPRAQVIPMDSLRVPIPAVDSTSNATSIFGGMVAYWTEEGAALTASQGSFGRVVLDAKKLTAYCEVPNELVADAPAFMAFIDQNMPKLIAWYEDVAFMSGSGVGEPLGYLRGNAIITYDAAVSSQVAWSDVVGMYARMLPSSLGTAVWLCSPDVFPQLAAMTFGTGQFPALVTIGGGTQPFQFSLLGRPLIVTEKQPALGTDGALSFVDFGYYLIGDRQAMTASSSADYKFGNDLTAFRVIERVDGRPWLNSAITPQNGSANTLSPFVQLSGLHT